MCAIFQLAVEDEREIHDICDAVTQKYGREAADRCVNSDIFPGGTAAVVGGEKKVALMRWGFPLQTSSKVVFNARSESLKDKRMFRTVLQNRCLVPATLFYEFGTDHKKYRFTLPERPLFYMAGLWARAKDAQGNPYFCFTVITTCPNAQMERIHDRMPVILPPSLSGEWLAAGDDALSILQPSAEAMNILPA